MNYIDIKPNDSINGNGVSVSLFVSGCPHHCKGCFNQETWDFEAGKPFGADEIVYIQSKLNRNNIIRNFSVLGGEPLCFENYLTVLLTIKSIKMTNPKSKVFVWTGYTYEELVQMYPSWYLEDIDVLIDGKFEIEKKDATLKLRGSSNQRVIDVAKTLKERKVILLDI